MARHIVDGKGHVSKGQRKSCNPTGKLSSLIDTKQMNHVHPCTEFVKAYELAEKKRAGLLATKGPFQVHKNKGKDGKITVERRAIGTAHSFVFG
jgi:hypothetical protein